MLQHLKRWLRSAGICRQIARGALHFRQIELCCHHDTAPSWLQPERLVWLNMVTIRRSFVQLVGCIDRFPRTHHRQLFPFFVVVCSLVLLHFLSFYSVMLSAMNVILSCIIIYFLFPALSLCSYLHTLIRGSVKKFFFELARVFCSGLSLDVLAKV